MSKFLSFKDNSGNFNEMSCIQGTDAFFIETRAKHLLSDSPAANDESGKSEYPKPQHSGYLITKVTNVYSTFINMVYRIVSHISIKKNEPSQINSNTVYGDDEIHNFGDFIYGSRFNLLNLANLAGKKVTDIRVNNPQMCIVSVNVTDDNPQNSFGQNFSIKVEYVTSSSTNTVFETTDSVSHFDITIPLVFERSDGVQYIKVTTDNNGGERTYSVDMYVRSII